MSIKAQGLYAGIYKPTGEVGILWYRLRNGERLNEQAETDRLSASGLKQPEHRFQCLRKHGHKPKKGQTHLWDIMEGQGMMWMENLRHK